MSITYTVTEDVQPAGKLDGIDTQGTTGSSGNLSLQSTLSDAYTDPSGAFRSGSVFSSGSLKVGAIRLFSHADATSLLAPGIGFVASTCENSRMAPTSKLPLLKTDPERNAPLGWVYASDNVD